MNNTIDRIRRKMGAPRGPQTGRCGFRSIRNDLSDLFWFQRIGGMKRRILLWLCPILILFVGVGLYAVLLFNRLGGSIDVILRENYQSVLAGQQMKESAERMDSGLSFGLAGEERRGRDLFNENTPLFQKSLRDELNNITIPGEGEIAEKIRRAKASTRRWRKPSGTPPIRKPGGKCISPSSCRCLPRTKTTPRKSSA